MPTYIYPTEKDVYLKVCETPAKPRCKNKGCLQHKINPGTLNFKRLLISQLEAAGVKVCSMPNYTKSDDGKTRDHEGRGYDGWLSFPSVKSAKVFLKTSLRGSSHIVK